VSYVCYLEIQLHFPENGSLKGKRKELVSLKAQLARRFGAAVAETDHHELWQRAELTAVLVGWEAGDVSRRGSELERFVHARFPGTAGITNHLRSREDLL
jgi:uncharacterized protein